MNRIVLIIALLFGGQALAQIKPIKETKWKANRFTVHAAVESFLMDNANDPSKVQIARISKKLVSTDKAYKWMGGWTYKEWKPMGVIRKGFWEPIDSGGWAVAVRFRTTNRLGALVLYEKVFCISNGVVFDWMKLGDFHPTRPKRRSDPLTDAFMKLAR